MTNSSWRMRACRLGAFGVVMLLAATTMSAAMADAVAVEAAADSGQIHQGAADDRGGDPWESFNRPIYKFNDFLDHWFMRPVAKGYQWIAPDPVEHCVSNFFGNLREPFNLANNLLQGKWRSSASDGGRLLINTTVGVVGLFDVARHWGLERSEEDLGQTLGHWGVGPGPYLVVPFLGPRTLRDASTGVVEGFADPLLQIDDVRVRNSLMGMRVVDVRAQLLAADELISGDRYTFLRDAYLQRRQFLVTDGMVEDDFGNDDFEAWDSAQ